MSETSESELYALSQIKIITNIRYNTDYEPAPEIPFLGDMEFANLNMENAVTGKPAITIDGFEGAEKNTAGIHFRETSNGRRLDNQCEELRPESPSRMC